MALPCLGGGTALLCPVTLWQWPRRECWVLALSVVVCTTSGATVHRQCHHHPIRWHRSFSIENEGSRVGHHRGHHHPMAVHHLFYPETTVFGVLAGVAPPPPV